MIMYFVCAALGGILLCMVNGFKGAYMHIYGGYPGTSKSTLDFFNSYGRSWSKFICFD